MQEKIGSKLASMLQNSYNYRGVTHKINDAQITEDMVFLSTNKRMLRFNHEQFMTEFKEFLPAEAESNSVVVRHEPLNGMTKTIKDTLMESINKVREDAKYIKQAEAINKSVNVLLNMAKLDLQAKKMELM